MPRENPMKGMRFGRWKFHGLTNRRLFPKDSTAAKHPVWVFKEAVDSVYGRRCTLTLVHAGQGHYLVTHTMDAKGKRNAEAFMTRARLHINARLREKGLPEVASYDFMGTKKLKEHPAARQIIRE